MCVRLHHLQPSHSHCVGVRLPPIGKLSAMPCAFAPHFKSSCAAHSRTPLKSSCLAISFAISTVPILHHHAPSQPSFSRMTMREHDLSAEYSRLCLVSQSPLLGHIHCGQALYSLSWSPPTPPPFRSAGLASLSLTARIPAPRIYCLSLTMNSHPD